MKNLNPKGNNVYDLILMLKLLSWVFSFTDWEKGGNVSHLVCVSEGRNIFCAHLMCSSLDLQIMPSKESNKSSVTLSSHLIHLWDLGWRY